MHSRASPDEFRHVPLASLPAAFGSRHGDSNRIGIRRSEFGSGQLLIHGAVARPPPGHASPARPPRKQANSQAARDGNDIDRFMEQVLARRAAACRGGG